MLQISNNNTTAMYFFIGLFNFHNLISAVKQLFGLIGNVYIICVCTVYVYYVYINTHTFMYIFKKNVLSLHMKYMYICYNLCEYKYIHISACKYFLNICCICVSLNIHNKYTQYTHIM